MRVRLLLVSTIAAIFPTRISCLSQIEDAVYESTVAELTTQAHQDPEVIGVLLTGSVARGDAAPGTDIDLRYVMAPGIDRPFRRFRTADGVLTEIGYADLTRSIADLDDNPMHVYAYLDGRILHDPQGALTELVERARQRFADYRMPEQDKTQLAFLLWCAREKIAVASEAGDRLKAAFAVGSGGWGIVEGLWAANERPLPPHSSVRPHLNDLEAGPPDVEQQFTRLFLGDTDERIRTALELLDWILPRLSPTAGDPTADLPPAAEPFVKDAPDLGRGAG